MLVIAILVLFSLATSLHSSTGSFTPSSSRFTNTLVRRQDPSYTTASGNLSIHTAKSIALPFGYQDSLLQLSPPRFSRVKRDPERTYIDALCKGERLYERLMSFSTVNREYGIDDVENGWTEEFRIEEADVSEDWYQALREVITPGSESSPSDAVNIRYRQNKDFTLDDGTLVEVSGRVYPTILKPSPVPANKPASPKAPAVGDEDEAGDPEGVYDVIYSVSTGFIVFTNVQSPKYCIKEKSPEITGPELERRVPPLNRLSDFVWTIWKDLTRNAARARKLRYLGSRDVVNEESQDVMNFIFEKHEGTLHVDWPGLTFDMDDEDGLALLATPNGLSAAYLAIEKWRVLGQRDNPKVRIWTKTENWGPETDTDFYYMLWDLGVPQ